MATTLEDQKSKLQADSRIWNEFVRNHPNQGLDKVLTYDQWARWQQNHPGAVPPERSFELWGARESAERLRSLEASTEQAQQPTPQKPIEVSSFAGIAAIPFAIIGGKIEEGKQVELAKEAILESPDVTYTLPESYKSSEEYDKRIKERDYKPNSDPVYIQYQEQIKKAVDEAIKKAEGDMRAGIKDAPKPDAIRAKIEYQYTSHFSSQFPEIADGAAKPDPSLKYKLNIVKKARERIEKDKLASERREGIVPPPQPPISPAPYEEQKVEREDRQAQLLRKQRARQLAERLRISRQKSPIDWVNNIVKSIRTPRIIQPPASQISYEEISPPAISPPRRGAVDLANNLYARTRGGRFLPNFLRFGLPRIPGIGGFGLGGGGTGGAVRGVVSLTTRVALATPPGRIITLIVIGVILLIILLAVLILLFNKKSPFTDRSQQTPGGQQDPGGTTTNIPGLTQFEKSGPTQLVFGGNIYYTITVSYSGTSDITIHDPIPQGTVYENSDTAGKFDQIKNEVVWKLKEMTPIDGKYILNLTVRPTADNILVINKAYARVVGGGSVDSTDFATLMRGQGRNTAVLGDEENFTQQIIRNGSQFGLTNKESSIRQIYKAAVAKNVNPLVVMVTWGTEALFQFNNTEFGCKPFGSGFNSQLSCSVNTWNNWMDYFEKNKDVNGTITLQSNIGKTCVYDDPFLFAAEKYGPVCTIYDSNDNFQSNFVKFYRKFLGL